MQKFSNFEMFPDDVLYYGVFENVTNSASLHSQVMNRKFQYSFVNAEMVISEYCLQAAANASLVSRYHNTLSTKNIHTELIYNLANSRKIMDSFQTFGLQKDSTYLIVAVFAKESEQVNLQEIASLVQGNLVAPTELPNKFNQQKVFQHYDIQKFEESHLEKAVLNRMATSKM